MIIFLLPYNKIQGNTKKKVFRVLEKWAGDEDALWGCWDMITGHLVNAERSQFVLDMTAIELFLEADKDSE